MAHVVEMPKLGLEVKPDEFSAWLASKGGGVTEGDPIAEIGSEKTTVEIDTKEDGVLRHVVLAEGKSTAPGGIPAIVTDADEDASGSEADTGIDESRSEPVATDDSMGDSSPTEVTETTGTATTGGGGASSVTQSRSRGPDEVSENGEVRAPPRAKRLADDFGVDLTAVEGTGPQGAITESDAETATEPATATAAEKRAFAPPSARHLAHKLGVDIEAVEGTGQNSCITGSDVRVTGGTTAAATDSSAVGAVTTATTDVTATSEPAETEWPLSGIRRTVADRLDESYREAAHITVDRRADAEELLTATNTVADALGMDVPITDILLLALLASLDERPELNATFGNDVHELHGEHNVCIAVDVDEGFIASVVHGVAPLPLSELTETRVETTQQALPDSFTTGDFLGGAFTVSSLGVLGVESFDSIINPLQVAILGVSTIRQEAVPTDDGNVVVRRIISFSLSFDHHIVDRADAARMLDMLAEHVENPRPLVIVAGGR